MSQSHDVVYTCPYCGKEFTIQVYGSVNAVEDPDLRDRCVSGEIFQQSCPHCHKDFMVQNDLVYIDPLHHFVIFLSEKEPGEYFRQYAVKLRGFTFRRCATVAEFTEKIQILEDGVSDILVELAKYDSFIEYVDNKKGKPENITAVTYQNTKDGVMKINVYENDKGMAFLIPVNMIQEEIDQDSDRYAVENTSFPHINGDWIRSLFKDPDGEA